MLLQLLEDSSSFGPWKKQIVFKNPKNIGGRLWHPSENKEKDLEDSSPISLHTYLYI